MKPCGCRTDEWCRACEPAFPCLVVPAWLLLAPVALVVLGGMLSGCAPPRDVARPCGHVTRGTDVCVLNRHGGCDEGRILEVYPERGTAQVLVLGYALPIVTACGNVW